VWAQLQTSNERILANACAWYTVYVGGKDGKTVCSHEETAPILELDMRNQEDHNPDSLVDCPFAVVKCG